ncbi:unnamed protein product, partial [Allacma fusca]
CLEAAPKDASKTCIKMCVLHNRGILVSYLDLKIR